MALETLLTPVIVAILVILVPKFADMAKIRAKAERGLSLIAAAGVLLLLAVSTAGAGSLLAGVDTVGIGAGATILFSVIAWIVLLIGALITAVELAKK